QADQRREPAKTMLMHVSGAGMRHGVASVAVGVKMHGAIVMTVAMEMHAVAPQPPQHMRAKPDQHQADGGLDRFCDTIRNGAPEQNRSPREDEQRQRVADTPGQPVLDDIADMGAARGDAGHRGDMIGFERMLHAQKKPETQNSEHMRPARFVIARSESDDTIQSFLRRHALRSEAWR